MLTPFLYSPTLLTNSREHLYLPKWMFAQGTTMFASRMEINGKQHLSLTKASLNQQSCSSAYVIPLPLSNDS